MKCDHDCRVGNECPDCEGRIIWFIALGITVGCLVIMVLYSCFGSIP